MSQSISRRDFLKLASLLPLTQLPFPQFVGSPQHRKADPNAPNVLILVFDALTAKQISLFGYPRDTMPNLARFAERATVFHNHRSAANFTSPGTSSLLTGTYPWSHRAIQLQGVPLPEFSRKNIFSLFAENGYHQTAYSHNPLVVSLLLEFRDSLDAFIPTRQLCRLDEQISDVLFLNDWSNSFQTEWDFIRGGEFPPGSLFLSWLHRLIRYGDKKLITGELGERFPRGVPSNFNAYFVLEDAIDWIETQLSRQPKPFLNYFHFLPPHDPYSPREDFVNLFNDDFRPDTKPVHPLIGRGVPAQELQKGRMYYDEYVAYADSEFGRLIDYMDRNNSLADTVVVLTSDHGEAFERGVMGHLTPLLHEPLLRTPLLISLPGQNSRTDIDTLTSSVDLLPTLLHLTGQSVPDWIEGTILPPFSDQAPDPDRSVFAVEAKSNPKYAPLTRKATIAMVKGDRKLHYYIGQPDQESANELYDLESDPEEMENLYQRDTSSADGMRDELEEILGRVNEPFMN